MDSTILIILLIVAVIAFFIWKQGSGGTTGTGISGAESQLLRMNLGDKNKVERLIQYEMRKKPGISRAEAAKAAVESLRYDNR